MTDVPPKLNLALLWLSACCARSHWDEGLMLQEEAQDTFGMPIIRTLPLGPLTATLWFPLSRKEKQNGKERP